RAFLGGNPRPARGSPPSDTSRYDTRQIRGDVHCLLIRVVGQGDSELLVEAGFGIWISVTEHGEEPAEALQDRGNLVSIERLRCRWRNQASLEAVTFRGQFGDPRVDDVGVAAVLDGSHQPRQPRLAVGQLSSNPLAVVGRGRWRAASTSGS